MSSGPIDFDPAAFVREFLERTRPNLERYPVSFNKAVIAAGNATTRIPVGLLGKFAQLQEKEEEITAQFLFEQGSLTQSFISRRTYNTTAYDSQKRKLGLKEERERSAARERWFSDLSIDEKTAFEQHCLTTVRSFVAPLIPESIPSCLHGALARLALEAAELARN